MNIIEKTYKWNGRLNTRGTTQYIVLHHRAGNGDVDSIHQQHLKQGYTGVGYHFYIRKDGSVYRGRPVHVVGAHCIGYNDKGVGVCFEGNFENEKMSDAQIKAGQQLVAYLKKAYPKAEVVRHRDLYATACPGKNFPFDEMKKGAVTVKKYTTANDIIWELMHGKLKVEITKIDEAVAALEKAKNEDSSLYWILYKIVNE